MAVEVEIKARVSSPDSLRENLHQRFGESSRFKRFDQYFRRQGDAFDHVRLRREVSETRQGESALITYKDKRLVAGVEQNLEIQFTISDSRSFTEFLQKLEFHPGYAKEKHVEVFYDACTGVSYELVFIPRLGWFIEIEKTAENKEEIQEAHQLVCQALKALGLDDKDIERRPYKLLLEEAETSS